MRVRFLISTIWLKINGDRGSLLIPVSTVNFVPLTRVLPLARKVCVWCRVAYGMMVLEEWFSKSADIAIDSPKKTTMENNKK